MKTTKYILATLLVLFSLNIKAQKNKLNDNVLSVELLNINTEHSDFGPAVIENDLIFSTYNGRKVETSSFNTKFYNLYSFKIDEKGRISENEKPKDILSSKYHEGPVSWCDSTNELFVTMSDLKKAELNKLLINHKKVRLGIFVYEKKGEKWVQKEQLPFNSRKYSVAHPAINRSGDTLIFSSDMEGGLGSSDLYYTVKSKGKWSKPVNLGASVNSKGSELYPYITIDGNLIYSSDGKGGQGKLDLLLTEFPIVENSTPANLQSINSSDDDFGLVIHPNMITGFFTSNRPGGKGEDDIYCLNFKEPVSDILALEILEKQNIKNKEEVQRIQSFIRKELDGLVSDMQNKKFISNNVVCDVDIEMIKEGTVPSLKVIFSYHLVNDTMKFQYDDYNLGKYLVSESNAVMATLSVMKNSLEGRLKKYIAENKTISITITGGADAIPIKRSITYSGEFGPVIKDKCKVGEEIIPMTISTTSGISNNEQLAFIRSYSVRDYMVKNIKGLKSPNITFNHSALVNKQEGGRYRRITIELIINDAMDEK